MKYLKTVLALLLSLAMLFCFIGCGGDSDKEEVDTRTDEEKIIGKWTAALDFSAYMNNMLATDLNLVEGVIPYGEELNSYVIFEFTADSVSMYFDKDATTASVQSYLDSFESLLAKDLYRQLEEAGLSAEEADKQFKDNYDVTIPEYAELIVVGTMSADEIAASFMEDGTATGVYKLEDGKLYVSDTAETLAEAPYYLYSFDGPNFLLSGASDETFFSSFADVGITFPIVFIQE